MIKKAYKLFHDGIQELSFVERNGIHVDLEHCKLKKIEINKEIEKLTEKIKETDLYRTIYDKYKSRTNIFSSDQLKYVLFNKMKIEPLKFTENGNPCVDKESLEYFDLDSTNLLLEIKQYEKLQSTYLNNIVKNTVNGFLHPTYNLHSVVSGRSSSSDPNFQNMPIRDPQKSEIIRGAFIPREGRQILEIDYKAIEVRCAATVCKDPKLIEYILDSTKDMHRDMAIECFKLPKKEVSKNIRYCAKNMFVFPQFYGDYYKKCADSMWKFIDRMDLKTELGIPLKDHLKNKNINTYNEFEEHIKRIEYNFWNNRFKVYADWKEESYREYLKEGFMYSFTGFKFTGPMKKNKANNMPIQSIAFHCLLWTLIRLNRWLRETKKKSLIIGQIHDSIVMDVVVEEVEEILRKTRQIACFDIREYWDWIIVPLEIEAEITPIDKSWFYKKEIVIAA
jgi:DNA polymerase-1